LQRYPMNAPPSRSRGGLVTPMRVVAALAIVGSMALLLYGLVRRDRSQIPVLAAGLVILGLTLLGAGFSAALASYRDARVGRSGPAFVGALFGGLCVLAGSGALTAAVVLALIWSSA
jgi:hypothetical protein